MGEESETAGDGWELRLFWNSLLGRGLDFSIHLSDSGVASELLEPKIIIYSVLLSKLTTRWQLSHPIAGVTH